ncbi:PCD23 protein, partial [Crocuta crocuta]
VNITVIDVNDNHPVFPKASDEVKISQTTLPGTALYLARAQDKDSGQNGFIRYTIASQNPSIFSIDSGLGVVYLNESLGSDAPQKCTLTLMAQDLGVPPRASLLVLTVVIEGQVQSPSLTFANLVYQVEVSESLSLMTQILQIQAYPLGPQRANSELLYSLGLSADSAVFGIRPHTGWIYLRRQLDYESTQTYNFRVFAWTPEDRLSQNVSTSVIVHVLDENDNSPTFLHDVLFLKVEESPVPQGVIGKITAIDRDSGKNGQLSYFLFIAADDQDGHFKIDSSTGDLFLSKELDYEMTSHYLFRVVTKDHSKTPPLNSTVFLSIDVEDQNDHSPSFQEELIVISVKENVPIGTLVHVFNAKDGDGSFLNSRIQYFIESHHPGTSPFLIHPSFGTLVTASPLDRERVPAVVLTITASDQAVNVTDRRVGSLMAKVVILDVNDHSPTFMSFPIAHIREDATVGSLVHHITAQDPDEGRNGRITYSILSGNENMAFMLDESSGDLSTTRALDREQVSNFTLVILCSDLGDPPRSSLAQLHVRVLDDNDHEPAFPTLHYQASVREDAAVGTVVLVLSAVDKDEGLNGQTEYFLAGETSGAFTIDPVGGTLRTCHTLDREARSQHTFRAVARDCSVQGSRSTTVIIKVHVMDVNDNNPVWEQNPFEIFLSPQIVSSQVFATDLDSGLNGLIEYSILSGNQEEAFHMDALSGMVTANAILDYEFTNSYRSFLVEASDGGIPDLSALTLVEIEIQDTNNYAPEFAIEYYNLSLSEDVQIGGTLLTFSTMDHDWTCENIHVDYSIISGNSQNNFHVETSFIHSEYPYKQVGYLVLLHSLDREAAASHNLVILASDHGFPPLSSTAIVSIEVLDVNDNPPKFNTLKYHAHVKESTPLGSHITVVSATDRDVGPHAEIVYYIISGNEKGHFHLEGKTGVLYLIKPLDYEEMTKFTLTIQASDEERKHFSFAVMFINVLDDNDHAPQFMFSSLRCVVPENVPVFSTICSVNALDFDAGPYGELTYSISS